jgi:hypothetical protein
MNYIYHKKPDGSIEQIEVMEDTKSQILHMYNLEKQLQEQRGEDFGIIYHDADSLPDEDKVTVGLMTQKEYDAKQIEAENAKIKGELYELDIKSIRSIREWIATQVDTPEYLKQYEAEAIEKRGKLK